MVPALFVTVSSFMVSVLFFISPGTSAGAVFIVLLGLPVYLLHIRWLRQHGLLQGGGCCGAAGKNAAATGVSADFLLAPNNADGRSYGDSFPLDLKSH